MKMNPFTYKWTAEDLISILDLDEAKSAAIREHWSNIESAESACDCPHCRANKSPLYWAMSLMYPVVGGVAFGPHMARHVAEQLRLMLAQVEEGQVVRCEGAEVDADVYFSRSFLLIQPNGSAIMTCNANEGILAARDLDREKFRSHCHLMVDLGAMYRLLSDYVALKGAGI